MKKTLSVFLALCLLLCGMVTLSSCSHECSFSTEWSFDEEYHWHACDVSGCELISEKTEHTWNDGEITTKPTQDSDGVKTFTCEVCGGTKSQAAEFTGLSKEDWDAALELSVFENFAYEEEATTTGNGTTTDSEVVYMFTKSNAWVYISAAGKSSESYAPDTPSVKLLREQLVDSIKDIANHAYYEYDAETKSYKAIGGIMIKALNAYSQDVTLTFDEGRLVKITYTISFERAGSIFNSTSTITLSDYGTVVLAPPST